VQLSQARLNALRMQLDPHFLFNALNTNWSQVERDPHWCCCGAGMTMPG